MLTARTSQIEHWSGGQLRGDDVLVRGLSIDTRKLAPGELYLALPGDHVDGHDYVPQARKNGAAAALVNRYVADPLPQVLVDDVQLAAGKIAAAHLRRHRVTVVAITGSNGKTTVKNLVALILSQRAPTLATAGNYNNELGLPLTLAKLSAEHRYVVLEMGAGKPGDIAYLCQIATPDVALVNNVTDAHLEMFGTREQIVETKGAIYAALSENGTAVINAGDAFAGRFRELAANRRRIEFGAPESDVRLSHELDGYPQRFSLAGAFGQLEIRLPLLGAHNRSNAAAATAVAVAAGASAAEVVAGLGTAQAEAGRLELHHCAGFTVVDDSYNANPASVNAALQSITGLGTRRWLVLGDMAELGPRQDQMHRRVGKQAASSGVERIYAFGTLAAAAARGFGDTSRCFDAIPELVATLQKDARGSQAVLLVKGSRAASMERIVQALCQAGETACCSG